jgi:hypothetical protein
MYEVTTGWSSVEVDEPVRSSLGLRGCVSRASALLPGCQLIDPCGNEEILMYSRSPGLMVVVELLIVAA